MDLTYFSTTLLTYYLPMPEGMMKMQLAMAIGQLLGQICEPIKKWVSEFNFWKTFDMENHITIESCHPQYNNIINYLYKRYIDQIKGANMNNQDGKKKMLIEVLQISSLKDGDIKISFGDLPKADNNKVDVVSYTLGKKIIFSSSKSLSVIEEYVSDVIKECCRKQNNTITTYSLDIEKRDKARHISWKQKVSTSNKTITNTIVKQSVKENFYDDLIKFMDSDDVYKSRGISYKRGYLLYGIPGSGKSSLVASVANEWGFPVFKMDLSILKDNEELTKAENIIYDYIGPFDPHIMLIEDFDRSAIFDGRSGITMDCILNILDGIEQTYGRIVILTANNVRDITRNSALVRPGRIDRMIEINYCDAQQVKDILKLYFERDAEINECAEMTPASLNKIIQIYNDFDEIVKFINRFKGHIESDGIERLAEEFKENPEITEEEIEEIQEEEVQTKSKYRRGRTRRGQRKSQKSKFPWGGAALEKYNKRIDSLLKPVTMADIKKGWRGDSNTMKAQQTDDLDTIAQKMEFATKEKEFKRIKLIEVRDALIQKMKRKGTWDEYIKIKNGEVTKKEGEEEDEGQNEEEDEGQNEEEDEVTKKEGEEEDEDEDCCEIISRDEIDNAG